MSGETAEHPVRQSSIAKSNPKFANLFIDRFAQQRDVIQFLHLHLNAADGGKVTVFFAVRFLPFRRQRWTKPEPKTNINPVLRLTLWAVPKRWVRP